MNLIDITTSITIIPTYRCTAECSQCCFESNPRLRARIDVNKIKDAIDQATALFKNLSTVVFSGGEVFLLKEELFDSIYYAKSKGLFVRCITNASWAMSTKKAEIIAKKLASSRVDEINISTGLDHQQFVTQETVINACVALQKENIFTLVTIEADTEGSKCFDNFMSDTKVCELLVNNRAGFLVQKNTWMKFHDNYENRMQSVGLSRLRGGCDQVMRNIVITPYHEVSVCCGLTFEHIPEMKIGCLDDSPMQEVVTNGFNDFVKIWLSVDGPATILESLFGDEANEEFGKMSHICEACSILHKNPKCRKTLLEKYEEFVPSVMARFALRENICQSLIT